MTGDLRTAQDDLAFLRALVTDAPRTQASSSWRDTAKALTQASSTASPAASAGSWTALTASSSTSATWTEKATPASDSIDRRAALFEARINRSEGALTRPLPAGGCGAHSAD